MTDQFMLFKGHLSLGIYTRQNSEFCILAAYYRKLSARKEKMKSVDYKVYLASGKIKKWMGKNMQRV